MAKAVSFLLNKLTDCIRSVAVTAEGTVLIHILLQPNPKFERVGLIRPVRVLGKKNLQNTDEYLLLLALK